MGSRAAHVVVGRASRIKAKLQSALEASALEVEDVSYQHAGHAAVKGDPNETHFNVKVVSNRFDGQSLVKRHRMVYDALADELLWVKKKISTSSDVVNSEVFYMDWKDAFSGNHRFLPGMSSAVSLLTLLNGFMVIGGYAFSLCSPVFFSVTEDLSGRDGGDGRNEEVGDCSQRNQVTLDVDPCLLKTVHDFRKVLGVEWESFEELAGVIGLWVLHCVLEEILMLSDLHKQYNDEERTTREAKKKELGQLIVAKEMSWKQKSRALELCEEDGNAKFFPRMASARNVRQSFGENGDWRGYFDRK
ncbi:hypothetical protein RJ639_041097 [Escallonia herrerae]|uniref:Uncharacterized protein n=1 Tax=Escallonia herrerae TaxID=1293975 RepID=A0AA88WGW9_9ASTE|nr:hypothetical protein RJ639_041097 [Escallonia herrerae]